MSRQDQRQGIPAEALGETAAFNPEHRPTPRNGAGDYRFDGSLAENVCVSFTRPIV